MCNHALACEHWTDSEKAVVDIQGKEGKLWPYVGGSPCRVEGGLQLSLEDKTERMQLGEVDPAPTDHSAG